MVNIKKEFLKNSFFIAEKTNIFKHIEENRRKTMIRKRLNKKQQISYGMNKTYHECYINSYKQVENKYGKILYKPKIYGLIYAGLVLIYSTEQETLMKVSGLILLKKL